MGKLTRTGGKYVDKTYQMNVRPHPRTPPYSCQIRQFLVKGRRIPDATPNDPAGNLAKQAKQRITNPTLFAMKIFAKNKVEAKSLFW